MDARFWSKVLLGSGCWEWQGSFRNSYGQIRWENGKFLYAHRLSWILNNGPIPKGLLVLHRCDNRKCVRPDHLFLGTHQENMDDMIAKDRQAKSDGQGQPITLTEDQVMEIRVMRQQGAVYREITKKFGISLKAAREAALKKTGC